MSDASITIHQLGKLLGRDLPNDTRTFRRVASYVAAGPDAIVFAQDDATAQQALASHAGLILAPLAFETSDPRVLHVKHPKYAFALAAQWMDRYKTPVVHPDASIDPDAKVGVGTAVSAGCVIKHGAVVGSHCKLGANVTIHSCVTLGDRVTVQSGAVLGSLGFGYVRGEDGTYIRFPQQGTVVIEDDVEIGANTTIDRGALGETRIGAGSKIDNLVHIGHNCTIGKNVMIAAQVGISGSCVVGDGVVMAGQVGLGDHVTIGAGVILGGASGVFPYKHLEGPGQLFMGVPAEPIKDYLKSIARIRRLK
jgi:UDP-3-O-[3-hydroxymyristoyl] glucosamine N-acyltransferase